MTCPFPRAAGNAKPKRAIRVCYLIDNLSRAGTERHVLRLIQGFDRGRIAPVLVLLDGGAKSSQDLEPKSCPVYRLNVRKILGLSGFTAAFRFVRILRHHRFDVLHINFLNSTYFGVLLGWLAGIAAIITTRRNAGHWLTPWNGRALRILNLFTRLIITNTEPARRSLLEKKQFPPSRVVVIPNGIDVRRFSGINPAAHLGAQPRVGVLANLRPVKGLDIFLDAAHRIARIHPGVQFVLAGDGDSSALMRQVEELQLRECVTIAGPVHDVPAFLATLDVAVLPSRAEGLSNALMEYMAAARPIVATDVGGTPQLIHHERTGLLVPAADPRALAVAVDRLLRNWPLAIGMGLAARNYVQRKFTTARELSLHWAAYRRALGMRVSEHEFA